MRKLILVTSIALSSLAQADGWISSGKVNSIQLKPDSNKFLITHDNMVDKDCGQVPSYYSWDMTKPMSAEIYSLILAAYSAGNTVNIFVRCTGNSQHEIVEVSAN